jgi:dihydroxyacetone kinase-like protein
MHFNEITGSTIGILIFSAMRAAGRVAIDKESVDLITLTIMLEEAIKAIKKRGKADVGQKTILDSLVPALNTLQDGLKSHQESEYKIIEY